MMRTCAKCQARNRIPAKHLADRGRCGSCKSDLEPIGKPLDVGYGEFLDIMRHARVPVLVDFWAAWCGPCRAAAPEVKRVAATMAGRALVLKVNIEAEPALAQRFGVQSIPHFLVLRGGKPVKQKSGVVPAAQLTRWLEDATSLGGRSPERS